MSLVYSTGNAYFDHADSWSPPQVPIIGDTGIILDGHLITATGNITSRCSIHIAVGGKLECDKVNFYFYGNVINSGILSFVGGGKSSSNQGSMIIVNGGSITGYNLTNNNNGIIIIEKGNNNNLLTFVNNGFLILEDGAIFNFNDVGDYTTNNSNQTFVETSGILNFNNTSSNMGIIVAQTNSTVNFEDDSDNQDIIIAYSGAVVNNYSTVNPFSVQPVYLSFEKRTTNYRGNIADKITLLSDNSNLYTVVGVRNQWSDCLSGNIRDSMVIADITGNVTLPAADLVIAQAKYGSGLSQTGIYYAVAPPYVLKNKTYGVNYGTLGALRLPFYGTGIGATLQPELVSTGAWFGNTSSVGYLEGTLSIPIADNVITGVEYGGGGNSLTGNRVDCPLSMAVQNASTPYYGASGTSFNGQYFTVDIEDVETGVMYGNDGVSYTGIFQVPSMNDVRYCVGYGASGTEFYGNVSYPNTDGVGLVPVSSLVSTDALFGPNNTYSGTLDAATILTGKRIILNLTELI